MGSFLNAAAKGNYQQHLVRQTLYGEPISRFMTREPIVAPPDVDLRTWVEDGDRLVGIVSLEDLMHFLNAKLELEDIQE